MGEEAKVQEEEVKAEEKKEEAKVEGNVEEKKEEEEPKKEEEEATKPPLPFVLFVDLHCVGCAKKIERFILKIRGVEGVAMDMAKNEVTIKGVIEPQAVCSRIMKKTKRRAKVLSPLPQAEGQPMPEIVASQVSGLATIELNVNMHCEACAEQLKKKILKMKGVRTAETELSSGKVTVTGTMDADRLVDYVYRRTKKQAKVVPQPEPEKPPEESPKPEEKPADAKPAEEEKKEEGDKKEEEGGTAAEEEEEEDKSMEEPGMYKMMYHNYQPIYVVERIPPAPQLFSDENPNACFIM
ncbi:heavy metal-associated isoprenylated plant protein 9 [Salvia miltiorrhiza]|uniref:heavy metal-associated isoprenylated plant protein 9 n=1 Tax=Salvia miltiorrhiza TaxID=226208 RepID=UPI0025AC885E|nr:heavy metal-associated isoprenylated plant protein 9 [Salvia miltiorrhiza]